MCGGMLFPFAEAQVVQRGVVLEMNSGNRPLAGVEIRATGAASSDSDQEGQFVLSFVSSFPGDPLLLDGVYKKGFEMVNREKVDNWNLSSDAVLKIVLGRTEMIDALRKKYYQIGVSASEREYHAALVELETRRKLQRLTDEEYVRRVDSLSQVQVTLKRRLEVYAMRFARLNRDELERTEQQALELLLLCNPHNPAGRVWTREELCRIGEICLQNNVTVLSDEIHCELVFSGYTYIPYASVSEEHLWNSVTCVSPSKSFNIAGLQIASIIARDETVRQRIDRAININEVCDVNPFGVEAAIAAYNEGEDWLLELLDYLKGNYDYLCAFFRTHLPEIPVTKLEGTYLVWTDCRALHLPSDTLQTRLLETTGLWLNSGTMYGAEGEGFLRWNIVSAFGITGCPVAFQGLCRCLNNRRMTR